MSSSCRSVPPSASAALAEQTSPFYRLRATHVTRPPGESHQSAGGWKHHKSHRQALQIGQHSVAQFARSPTSLGRVCWITATPSMRVARFLQSARSAWQCHGVILLMCLATFFPTSTFDIAAIMMSSPTMKLTRRPCFSVLWKRPCLMPSQRFLPLRTLS